VDPREQKRARLEAMEAKNAAEWATWEAEILETQRQADKKERLAQKQARNDEAARKIQAEMDSLRAERARAQEPAESATPAWGRPEAKPDQGGAGASLALAAFLALALTSLILQEAAVEREVDGAFWFFPSPPRVARAALHALCVRL
jgi:ferric-dicitrate binding protein FerR (iron transport regulator)